MLPDFDDASGLGSGGALDDALEAAFDETAADEVEISPIPDLDDAQLERLAARVAVNHGREHLSALSALSQQMEVYHPLSPQEQTDRLVIYRAGLTAAQQLAAGDLAGRDERLARTRVRQGEYAQTELLGSMFRLVLVIARELATERYGRAKALDMMEDIVGETNVALVQSLAEYNEAKCPTFSLYAMRVIRDKVRMSLQSSALIKPAPSWLRLKRIYTVRMPELENSLGRKPTEDEVKADLLRVCMAWADKKLSDSDRQLPQAAQDKIKEGKLRKQGMLGAIANLQEVILVTQQLSSLDSPLGDEGGSTLGDLLVSGTSSSGEFSDPVEFAELSRDLHAALATLPDREREIMLHRFGFISPPEGHKDWTYVMLAPKYGVSAERIRQIERNVIGKLKGPGFTHLAGHLPSQVDQRPVEDDTDDDRRGRRGRRHR